MSQKSPVKKFSKDILARAMAQEDITVQHSASAETAYFDTLNRVLCLPIWKDMDNSMYDMLVGHEVSHALHTPAEGWQEFVGKGSGSGMRHMFLNVVEDARIERMIKDKFPGLRRDFSKAYGTLNERDIFEIAGKDLSTLALVDRLNLQFKTGLHCGVTVPFTSTEQAYVTRMAETKTFDDVMELARELYELQKEEDEQKEEQQQGQEQQPQAGEGSGSGSGDVPDDNDQDESGEGSGSGLGGEEDDSSSDTSESTSGAGDDADDQDGEDSGASAEDDTDDGESADSTDGDGQQSGDGESEMSYDDYENNIDAAGGTQRSFEQGMSDMRDESSGEYSYHTLPTPNLENIVVDFTTISDIWDNLRAKSDRSEDSSTELSELHDYRQRIKSTVNIMVQQFQMKQAAEADKKTEIAKTGVLDTVSMINYRWSEDIFLKNEVHPDGKNHGMVMYVDWSGSMSSILKDTVEQLLVLVEFCKKVQIPFEVYAFSSNEYRPNNPHDDRYSDEARKWNEEYETNNPQWNMTEGDTRPHSFQLYNWLSSRMNKRQYQRGLQDLWILTNSCNYYGHSRVPRCFGLGSTPLNEAVLCAMTQVPEFQRMHGIQIVNTVVLSDGEGHSMCRYRSYGGKTFITDKKSKKTYEIEANKREGETMAFLEMLKDRTGCNTIGVRLHAAANIRHMRYSFPEGKFEKAAQEYKKHNFTTLESSYDEYFLVRGDLKVETDALEDIADDASFTRLKNAFIKGGNNKKSSRVIATKMVDIFAT